ncbi:MAG: UDP-N-acetylmuramoyl-L-alanyl-D-glutamate--2,6-diaminopimelate ligase [Acidimicrobiia bacterium]
MRDLLDGLDVVSVRGDVDVDVRSVVHDSRDVAPGALFACIRGAVTDGHTYAAAAAGAGAVGLLVEEPMAVDVAQARVPWVRGALGPVAARFHDHPSAALRVLGVTGTNGKTTTTYLLDAIARAAGEVTGVIGTVATRVGGTERPPGRTTPEADDLQALLAEMRAAAVTTVALEVSSHALDQHRVDGTRFAAVGFTNLSQDHLDYHGTMDAYFAAKARLFTPAFTPAAAISIDDPRGRALVAPAAEAGLDVWTVSVHDETAALHATAIELAPEHTRLTVEFRRDDARVALESSLVGAFNVANALTAAAIARAGGFSVEEIAAGLQAPLVVPGRFERVDAGQDFTVLVDYAHTPDALERALVAARELVSRNGRLAVVYGCGGDRDRAKRPLMGAIAAAHADTAYLTSDNPRSEDPAAIAAAVLAGVPADRAPVVELDRRAAIRAAVAAARAGDVIVIAGKGHEPGQTAAGVTVPFDDRTVAREALEGERCG